ncbi:hypothetical protein SPRG_03461 [Saprolegnia parasitica CBS 223.65]|uniref:Pyridoxal phosphate phosphatase n=1 Tax=Saprolegnia parasitica (strain CBS 223.65) TaxID=695850 RepID=A0A067CLX7_SAPPC|nr:hypothetical protein SPRG_03461 [Saprolegnia parasitica CBS 223.65]KDO31533.1 hypothetical protein SPRG_03461 [Saprolegnia parasitica CBS 223.65]|eukprot:XP_012197443.1 hypothetical protein SPRG_03461 [Saprolegnia parasitica CBS 223.65]
MALVVFDYDWSLINDNSDTFVFKELQPALLDHLKQLTASGVQWTDAVDQTLGQLTSTTREELIEAIARVPVQPGMLEAVRFAHAQGAEVMIVSDANTVFIESMLALHGLQDIVRHVFTNPGTFDGNILRVHPFHPKADAPHGCPKCPVNMCKGSILRTIKAAKPYTKILYIGTTTVHAAARILIGSRRWRRGLLPDVRALLERLCSGPRRVRARQAPRRVACQRQRAHVVDRRRHFRALPRAFGLRRR